MKIYHLYLESGPKRKKTLMHVLELAGCVHQSATTDLAIEEAPEAIREFLRFLNRCGERVDPETEFKTVVAEENLSGGFLGSARLPTDDDPIDAEEAATLLNRVELLVEETLTFVSTLDGEQLEAKPEAGRSAGRILSHITGAAYSYVTTAGFRIEGLHALAARADKGLEDPRTVMRAAFAMIIERLRGMTDDERAQVHERSTGPWTVRRMYRELLEHDWEHYREVARRLEPPRRA